MFEAIGFNDFVLPRNGHAASGELAVEVVVTRVNVHAFDSGKLLNVKNVFGIDRVRLQTKYK